MIGDGGPVVGRLSVVGVGPAGPEWITPEVAARLEAATDLVGYGPYLERIAGPHHRVHASDNREELARAMHALDMAAEGRDVVVVSGGDPGVFAMAAAIFEALEGAQAQRWAGVEVDVTPGVSAMQAAAARLGAPLGNDFCVISLSDNLKPWSLIQRRVRLAAEADFAMAFYNPISRARPWQLGEALGIVREAQGPDTLVVLATAVGRGEREDVQISTLGEVDPTTANMSTLVIVGAASTRVLERPSGRRHVYTPRYVESAESR
ncbi:MULTISPECIES: precorrin-3B C(17)-methyltransferase [unclassified Thioalkalivibrio]|uniref:precorrin-3B C(17)-methyltransferase n=1 Tax=unclassified Thioalkalivibrio TaxID=2621013 RepID=UPI00036C501D|nr:MULTISPECIES: precorrin-3B C(17)-methyltransferase [unclassified Thioalkalivibrio]